MEAKAIKINPTIICNYNLNQTCILHLSSSKSSNSNSRNLQKMMLLECRKAPYQLILTFVEPTKYLNQINLANKISNNYHNKNINKRPNNSRSYHLLKVLSAYLSLTEALHKQRTKEVIRWGRQRKVSSLEEQEENKETCILLSQM